MVGGGLPGSELGLQRGGGAALAPLLRQIESWLERAVEGGTRAMFRQRLQPIELAKAAARAMERQRLVGPEGIEVPNTFTVALHPTDLAELAAYQAGLEQRLARYLSSFADDRRLEPVGPITVSLLADPLVRRRSVRVVAEMDDLSDDPSTRPAVPISATEPLPRVRRGGPGSGSAGSLLLVLEDGRHVSLPSGGLRIGRALDNDLVIADSRVSRYHAQVFGDGHGMMVRDLGSTNGTAVAGRVVAEDRLAEGDALSLGGYRIDVRPGPRGGGGGHPPGGGPGAAPSPGPGPGLDPPSNHGWR
jgi:hypothetical protein